MNPENKNNIMEPNVDLRKLRTYEDDLQDAISNDGMTTAKIVMAEQAKKDRAISSPQNTQQTTSSSKTKSINKIIIFFSFVLISVGGFLIYYNFASIKPFVSNIGFNSSIKEESIIVPNNKITIDSIGKTKGEIVRQIQERISARDAGVRNEIIEIEILKNSELLVDNVMVTKKVPINAADFFSLIDASAPDNLIRSFSGRAVIGLHKLDKQEPFIILKSDNMAQTYTGMLNWESSMGSDLNKIFFENLTMRQTVTNTNPSRNLISDSEGNLVTEDVPVLDPAGFNPRKFVDKIITNKDTRAIINNGGEVLFFYSLVDNDHVVMTTNKDTLSVVLNRINQINLMR